MTYYATITSTNLDEWTEYEGIDLNEALHAYDRAKAYTYYNVEVRAYELPDDTNINDRDELIDAISECLSYDVIK